MSQRTVRRAAERKARKAAAKQNTPANNTAQPSAPIAASILNPKEEADVEVAEFHAQRRQREIEAYPMRSLSEVQLAANRANAQHSTGPVTQAGKAASSLNHFRHGLTQSEGHPILVENESEEEYRRSLQGFESEWKPAGQTEQDLVQRLASHQWLRRRALRLQHYYVSPSDGQIVDLANFNLYRRYEVQHERAYNKALSDLIRIRSLRQREQNGFESQRRKNELQEFKVRHAQHRATLHEIAIRIAKTRAALLKHKLQAVAARMKPAGAVQLPGTPGGSPAASAS